MVYLDGLRPLYSNMLQQELDRCQFDYAHNGVRFDVFFFIDTEPFSLLFGAKGTQFSMAFEVEKGFKVNPFIEGNVYYDLCALLGLRPDPENPFRPEAFLKEFNRAIPNEPKGIRKVEPQELMVYRRNVEEADKIWFCGWRNNEILGEKVSEKNLEKTRVILGEKIYKYCKEKNISSRWTDIRRKAREMKFPA